MTAPAERVLDVRLNWPPVPYPGLRPFVVSDESDESLIFFGRQQQVYDLLERLGSSHFVAVLGPSGCGKSSLVRAGLIPALKSGLIYSAGASWVSALTEPGGKPIRNLAQILVKTLKGIIEPKHVDKVPTVSVLFKQLKDKENTTALVDLMDSLEPVLPPNMNILLVVDQFEEIFRRGFAKKQEDSQFINLLLNVFNAHPERLYVVSTMRTDYLEHCANFHGLPEALNESQYLTPRLNQQQLIEAIQKPVEQVHYGGSIEPALVRRIIKEMTSASGYDADQLPLMQHALFWLWKYTCENKKEGEPILLSQANYFACGGKKGLMGVLSKRANDIYNKLTPTQKRIAECMFRLLSTIDNSGRKRRRVTSPEEIAKIAGVRQSQVRTVIEIYADPDISFIRWKDNETKVDVTHESLIRQWDMLNTWAIEERAEAEEYRDTEKAAINWNLGKGTGALLGKRGVEVWNEFLQNTRNIQRWSKRYGKDFNLVKKYIKSSSKKIYEEERAKIDLRILKYEQEVQKKQFIYLIAAAGIGIIISLVASLGWYNYALQAGKMEDQAKILARKNFKIETALNKAHTRSYQAAKASRLALRAIILRRTMLVEKEIDSGRPATALRLALDTLKHKIAKVPADLALSLARAATKAPVRGNVISVTDGSPVTMSRDGQRIITISDEGTPLLWDAKTGMRLRRIGADSVDGKATAAAFSNDGRQIVVGYSTGKIRIYHTANTSQPRVLPGPGGAVSLVKFSPTGSHIVTKTPEREGVRSPVTVKVWDAASDKALVTQKLETQKLGTPKSRTKKTYPGERPVSFSKTGKWFGVQTSNDTIKLWNLENGDELKPILRRGSVISGFTFGPGPDNFAITVKKTVRINNIVSRKEVGTVQHPEKNDIRKIVFSADGSRLLLITENAATLFKMEKKESNGGAPAISNGRLDKIILKNIQNAVFNTYSGDELVTFSSRNSRGKHLDLQYWVKSEKIGKYELEQRSEVFDSYTVRNQDMPLITWVSSTQMRTLSLRDDQVRTWDIFTSKKHVAQLSSKLVHETSHSTGVGNFTLTASNGKQTFKDEFGIGGRDLFNYFILSQKTLEWEHGTGHMSDDTTLVRDSVLASSNAGELISFSDGPKDVINDNRASSWPKKFVARISKLRNSIKLEPFWAKFTNNDGMMVIMHRGGLAVYRSSAENDAKWQRMWKSPNNQNKRGSVRQVGLVAGISPKGRYIVAPTNHNVAMVYDLESMKKISELHGHTNKIYTANFSADGKKILTTSSDGTVRVWSFNPNKKILKTNIEFDHSTLPHLKKNLSVVVSFAAFDENGEYVITATRSGIATLWRIGRNKEWVNIGENIKNKWLGGQRLYAVGFSENGKCVFVETERGKLKYISRDDTKQNCETSEGDSTRPHIDLSNHTVLSHSIDRKGVLLAITGMGTNQPRSSILALFDKKSGLPIAVWRNLSGNWAGWAGWSAKSSKIIVPIGKGEIHVHDRPQYETWTELIAYSNRVAKRKLTPGDRKRLDLIPKDELQTLSDIIKELGTTSRYTDGAAILR